MMGVEVSAVASTQEPSAPASTPEERSSTQVVVPRGWGDLYREHADFVWRSLRRLGLGPDAAKDSLHDVFLIVHRRIDSFDPKLGSERAWLFGIAANVARSERRRRVPIPVERLEPLLDQRQAQDRASPSVSGEYRVGYFRVREKIMAAVIALSPERRAVFSMYELEGMSCLEIANEMGVAIGTVYSRLHAARAELRSALSDYEPEGARRGEER